MIIDPRSGSRSRAGSRAWPLFLNLDDQFSFAQLFLQALILTAEFLVLNRQSILFRFRTAQFRKGLL